MAGPSASQEGVAIHNETKGVQSRYTRAGLKLTYSLTVVQQPERARACGQGAKSSSDRRPVDPPPIIELRISEGDEPGRDVTFLHNASLFLYATLENARPIAQGRLPTPATSNAAILTGSPVTGISYLERPKPAGYFIFPDLSVRHEGKYRLAFTLYEEVKHPQDMDSDASPSERVGSHVYARCEVKSKPFDVYSAKKFPGLMESTMLSRTVADQGCRVRIRRDIRVRRPETKPDKDWEDYGQVPQAAVADSQTAEKKPSASEVDSAERSAISNAQASQPVTGPVNGATQPSAYQPPAYGYSMPQHASQPPYSHNNPQSQGHSAPQQQQHLQQPYAQPSYPPYMPQHPQYPMTQYSAYSQGYYAPPPQGGTPMAAYGYPGHPQSYQQPMQTPYAPQQPYLDMRGEGQVFNAPYAMSNGSQHGFPGQAPMNAPYTTMEQQAPTPAHASDRPLPPLKGADPTQNRPASHASPTVPAATNGHVLSAPQSNESMRGPAPHFNTQAKAGQGAKRAYSATFNTQHVEKPMRSGARPSFANGIEDADGSEEDLQDWNDLQMHVRRADGTYTQLERHRI